MRFYDIHLFPIIISLLSCFLFESCVWSENDGDSLSATLENGSEIQYLPIDDSEYPYAGIPRVVIETENFKEIRNKETEIPAKMQIWGEKKPESRVYNLTIRGRGNSSFHAMPKYSLKLSFPEKEKFFHMPKDKKWALISYFADKTLIRNYFITKLDSALGSDYSPRIHFVEVYLNRVYMGIYGFCETLKISKNRIDISEDSAFFFEKTTHVKKQKPHIITKEGNQFEIKHPKENIDSINNILLQHLDSLEAIIYHSEFSEKEPFSKWIDTDCFYRYYWLTEFSKNADGRFNRSTYMTWQMNNPIKMTPVWDFDLTFGSSIEGQPKKNPSEWFIKNANMYWRLFSDKKIWEGAKKYWQNNKNVFYNEIEQLDSIANVLRAPEKNEQRKWSTLGNDEFWSYKESYSTYDEAVDSLKSWAKQRYQWIDNNL